jgi:N-acyl-D-amino-acid deacylase
MLDLLIRDGLIIDGSGNPGFYGAVAVEGEQVHILRGDLANVEAARIIDAKGRIVCPGFIDMHAHSGLVMLAEPRHEPKVRQGVTTELIGVDGNSYAPFRSHEDFLRFVEVNSGLDGEPAAPRPMVHGRAIPVDVQQPRGRECRLYPRQFVPTHLWPGLGRPSPFGG